MPQDAARDEPVQTAKIIDISDTVADVQFVASALFRSASAIQPVNEESRTRSSTSRMLAVSNVADHMVQCRCGCWHVVSNGIQCTLVCFSPGCRLSRNSSPESAGAQLHLLIDWHALPSCNQYRQNGPCSDVMRLSVLVRGGAFNASFLLSLLHGQLGMPKSLHIPSRSLHLAALCTGIHTLVSSSSFRNCNCKASSCASRTTRGTPLERDPLHRPASRFSRPA